MTEKLASSFHFEGLSDPNGTIVPDAVFDVLMPQLKDGELRVLLYIIRRTFGFKKASDNISLKQMVDGITKRDGEVLDRGTGLKKSSVAAALQGLREKDIITVVRNTSVQRGYEPTTYRLRFKGDPVEEVKTSEEVEINQAPMSGYTDMGVSGYTDKGLSAETDIQQTVIQTTVKQPSNIRKRLHADFSVDNSTTQPPKPHRNGSVEEGSGGPTTKSATSVGLADLDEMPIKKWGMEAIGEILKKKKGRPTKQESEEREMIMAFIRDFAREFHDQAQLKSSVSRAFNIYKDSGLSPVIFQDRMYQARLVTKDYQSRSRIKGSVMAYYFSVLEDQAGLKDDSDQPAMQV